MSQNNTSYENSDANLEILLSLIDDQKDENLPSVDSGDSTEGSKQVSTDLEAEMKQLQERMQQLQQQLAQKNNGITNANSNLSIIQEKRNVKIIKEIDIFNRSSANDKNVTEPSTQQYQLSLESEKLFGSEVDTSDEEQEKYPLCRQQLNEFGKFVKKRLARQPAYERKDLHVKINCKPKSSKLIQTSLLSLSSKENDSYSNIRIKNPVISSTAMKQRMEGRKMIKMSLMHMHIRGGDIEGDWFTIGVIVNKLETKTSSKGNTYSVWKLSDLQDCTKIVSMFLFGKVHQQLWKTQIGNVIGILNASIMPNRENQYSTKNEVSITVDNPQKIMLMGTAKDLGCCKGRRKDGSECTMFVNTNTCAYCPYHVQSEYKKVSRKRVELQSSYSGAEPHSIQQKLLKNQQIMYGGNLYINPRIQKKESKMKKACLDLNPKLNYRAEKMQKEVLIQSTLKGKNTFSPDYSKAINTSVTSEALSEMLSIPSVGSRNLIQHFLKQDKVIQEKSRNPEIQIISPGTLLKQHNKELLECRKNNQTMNARKICSQINSPISLINKELVDASPKLGLGLGRGDDVFLDIGISSRQIPVSPSDLAKMKAVVKLRKKGPIMKENPNAIKKTKLVETERKILKRVQQNINESSSEEKQQSKRQKITDMDINFPDFLKILNRKSIHASVLNAEEAEKQTAYFNHLEQKEQLETKMSSITEVKCSVVSCKTCKYTALSASERCTYEGHPLLYHKANKRFFKCKKCNQRIVSFHKIPIKPCRNCGENTYERTSMWKEKSGPRLQNEILSLRGDETKFLGSLQNDKIFLNL